jgi:hypothetical protein
MIARKPAKREPSKVRDGSKVAMTGITGSPTLQFTRSTPTADRPRFGKRDRAKLHRTSVTKVREVTGVTLGTRKVTHHPVTGVRLPDHEQYEVVTVVETEGNDRKRGGSDNVRFHYGRLSRNPIGELMDTVMWNPNAKAKVLKERVKSREPRKDGKSKGAKGALRENYHDPANRYNLGRNAIDYDERCNPVLPNARKGKKLTPKQESELKGTNALGWKVVESHREFKVWVFTLSNGTHSKRVESRLSKYVDALNNVCNIHGATAR